MISLSYVARDAKTAREQLEQSLRRLRTDHLDLWQFHEIVYDNDPDWVFENGGAIETALKARDEGKIRYLGFTGHKDPGIHMKMLGMPYRDWDSVQMPLNVLDGTFRSFQKNVLPVLLQRGIAPIGMKSLVGSGPTLALLRATGAVVEEIPSGCCGMAGSFGYEREHYDLSLQIGELVLLPAARAAAERGVRVAAPGVSCRSQLSDGAGVRAVHPIEVVAESML